MLAKVVPVRAPAHACSADPHRESRLQSQQRAQKAVLPPTGIEAVASEWRRQAGASDDDRMADTKARRALAWPRETVSSLRST
eukprot:3163106-Pleurochrysis_carterae.AAC.2